MEYNPFSLQGRTILITGASSGIGQTSAVECSKLGAKVILTARNETRLKETYEQLSGEGHQIISADLTNEQDLENLVASVGKVDGLVLCAGKGLLTPILFATRDKFDGIFNINFFSPIELLRLLIKKKKMEKNSSVVFIVSVGGTARWTPGNAIYGTSKAALNSMIRYCAVELAPKHIRVNGVCPAMVETPMIQLDALTEEQKVKDMEQYPLKRYGKPEDIAFGIVYLLSNASSWVTGQSLVIDGGITI